MESFSVPRNQNAAETICTTIVISRLRTVMITAKAIDGGLLIAAGNDYGFDEIFARQVAAFGAPGDVLICLTTSGKSKNVERALEEAKARQLKTIALLGCDAGSTIGMADVDFLIRSIEPPEVWKRTQLLLYVLCEGECKLFRRFFGTWDLQSRSCQCDAVIRFARAAR